MRVKAKANSYKEEIYGMRSYEVLQQTKQYLEILNNQTGQVFMTTPEDWEEIHSGRRTEDKVQG